MLFSKKISWVAGLTACILLAGCGPADNPGTWNQEKVADYVQDCLAREVTADGLQVENVTLSPKAGGGFEGTAKASDGQSFKLDITQDPAAQELKWVATGDRGSNFDGSYAFETVK